MAASTSISTSEGNRHRRLAPGLLLAAAYPFLKLLAWILARRAPAGGPAPRRILVYQAYQVGDFFMALPAIRLLARHMPVTVIGRPDCLFTLDALEGLGAGAVPFDCPFFARPSPGTFLRSLRNAWALRRRLPAGVPVLDPEADPRTAFFLKVAGLGPLIGYDRPFAWLFDRRLALPVGVRHQGAKAEVLAAAWLREQGFPVPEEPGAEPASHGAAGSAGGPLLLSCWTRKDTKNWPFAHWDALLESLSARHPLAIVAPPDGDAEFRAFRARWETRIPFLSGSLPELRAAVRGASGIVATDNFLGHMAAWEGRPVLWINGSSDPDHVAPRSPRLRIVQVDPMPCRPCGHRCVNPVYKQCLKTLAPEAVRSAAEDWIRGFPAGGA